MGNGVWGGTILWRQEKGILVDASINTSRRINKAWTQLLLLESQSRKGDLLSCQGLS